MRGSNEYLTTQADVITVEGDLLVRTRSTIVSRGTAVNVGEVLRETVRVERVNLVMYAGASGDFNPIHWNEHVAKAVGLPDVIAHGMFTQAAARAAADGSGGRSRAHL